MNSLSRGRAPNTDFAQLYNDRFYEDTEGLNSARIYLKHLWRFVEPASVVDVGCGRGTWLKVCRELGSHKLVGIDGSWNSQSRMIDDAIRFEDADLNHALPSNDRFDLAISLEVAEHLEPSAAPQFVQSLTERADLVLFSAAYTMQGGTNHLNEQPHTYWARLFAQCDFVPFDLFRPVFWGNPDVCFYYRQNTFLYAKTASASFGAMKINGMHPMADISFMDCIHPDLYGVKAARAAIEAGFKDHLFSLIPSLLGAVRRRVG